MEEVKLSKYLGYQQHFEEINEPPRKKLDIVICAPREVLVRSA